MAGGSSLPALHTPAGLLEAMTATAPRPTNLTPCSRALPCCCTRLFFMDQPTLSVEETADVVGIDPNQVIKSLVFLVKDQVGVQVHRVGVFLLGSHSRSVLQGLN